MSRMRSFLFLPAAFLISCASSDQISRVVDPGTVDIPASDIDSAVSAVKARIAGDRGSFGPPLNYWGSAISHDEIRIDCGPYYPGIAQAAGAVHFKVRRIKGVWQVTEERKDLPTLERDDVIVT